MVLMIDLLTTEHWEWRLLRRTARALLFLLGVDGAL